MSSGLNQRNTVVRHRRVAAPSYLAPRTSPENQGAIPPPVVGACRDNPRTVRPQRIGGPLILCAFWNPYPNPAVNSFGEKRRVENGFGSPGRWRSQQPRRESRAEIGVFQRGRQTESGLRRKVGGGDEPEIQRSLGMPAACESPAPLRQNSPSSTDQPHECPLFAGRRS